MFVPEIGSVFKEYQEYIFITKNYININITSVFPRATQLRRNDGYSLQIEKCNTMYKKTRHPFLT